jgi:hypothetical protein
MIFIEKLKNFICIIIINSYSLWHRLETTHAKDAIYITERKTLKGKKNPSTSIQSLPLSPDDAAPPKCRVNDVFEFYMYNNEIII